MKERKISKKKLVALSGISVYDYRKMKENKDVSLMALRKICLTLSVEISELVNFKKGNNKRINIH